MKAFLLAAGMGSRLRPLTDTVPKCLVPIAGRPLLDWWTELLHLHGVTETLINTHHHSGQVREYIAGYNARRTGLHLYEFYEETLLGSGGTVLKNRDFVSCEDDFFICYADNLTKINLTALRAFHRAQDGLLTMALFRAGEPSQCGIAELDSAGRIISFTEKPAKPVSNLANAGVYIADNSIFHFFPDRDFIDFGRDMLPAMIGRMYGFEINGYHLDIGTPDNLRKAREEWQSDNF